MITTMFFDLDDTFFDHRDSRRCGFEALKAMQPALMPADILDRERVHEQLICANDEKVLDEAISIHGAMTERICTLRTRLGLTLPQADTLGTVRRYDTAFRKTRRAVPGSRELLELLKDTVTVGIITNGFRDLQEEKIAICRISPLIDILVISEETGEKNRT